MLQASIGSYSRATGLQCSMARKGECLDNAVAESFFGSLKNELVYHKDFKTRAEARQKLFKYTEVFYNRRRRHAYLDYKTPEQFFVAATVCNTSVSVR